MSGRVNRRQALKGVVGTAVSGGFLAGSLAGHGGESVHREDRVAAPGRSPGQQPWYRRLLVGIEVGPTGPMKTTGREIVDHLLLAGAEYGVVFMRDGDTAYYNSKITAKFPGLGDRDLLRECVEEGAKHGIPIIAYCQVQYAGDSWRAHPEWRMKDAGGKDIQDRLCYNSGYRGFIKQLLDEMMAYKIAGFHVDMLDFGFGPPLGCWCEHCRKLFRERYKTEMPKGATWDENWEKMLQFRCDSNTAFCQEIQAHVHQRRPDVSVDFNYHAYPPFSWQVGERPIQHAQNGDFVTCEGLPWVFGHNNPSFVSLYLAGARRDGAIQVATSDQVSNYCDFTVRPAAEMVWEVLTYAAHGVQCTMVDKATADGTFHRLPYERIRPAFTEVRAKREFFQHRPLPEVGLCYSTRSRDWYGRDNPASYHLPLWGAHRALVQSHIPLGVIIAEDDNLSLEQLRRYPVVYLAGTAILSAKEADVLGQYVSGGGSLLVTGVTGFFDRMGRKRPQSRLQELLGVQAVQCRFEEKDHWIRLPSSLAGGNGDFLTRDIPSDWPLFVQAPTVVCKPAGAQGFGEMLASPGKDALGPAVFVHPYGKGIVAYVPSAIDAAFVGERRMPEHRNLIANLVRRLHPQPLVTIQAPRNVETVVTYDDDRQRLLVHFLSFSAPATFSAGNFGDGRRVLPPMMEESDRYLAEVRIHRPFSRVWAAGRETKINRQRAVVYLQIARIHEVLVCEG